ncbi:MAG: Crp/Fnr family transcriptional regulator [Lachnospiraceae bacterium]|nr:Crp/Fnr family transcriptional regulator [Lachnospiraceae bacterium]
MGATERGKSAAAWLESLGRSKVFNGISPEEIDAILSFSGAREMRYRKGEVILREGERIFGFGILAGGTVQSYQQDAEGNRVFFTTRRVGDLLTDEFAFGGMVLCPWNILVLEEAWVIWIDIPHSMEVMSRRCVNHARLLRNLLQIQAEKNIELAMRVTLLSKKTIRARIVTYLQWESDRCGAKCFDVKFSRDEMADYLGVDRSALSRTLSNMKKEGVIDYVRGHFEIKF